MFNFVFTSAIFLFTLTFNNAQDSKELLGISIPVLAEVLPIAAPDNSSFVEPDFNDHLSFSSDSDEDDYTFDFYDSLSEDKARWSYAPGFVEKWCRKECIKLGKPFGRLVGTRCQCLCPMNAGELGLCGTTGLCDRFCASEGFPRGGDCVFNDVCFCYCRKQDPYNIWGVYTTPPSA